MNGTGTTDSCYRRQKIYEDPGSQIYQGTLMEKNNQPVKTCATVPFKSILCLYDPDDPSPEESRELSSRAEEQILREVLDVPKGYHHTLFDHLVILLPASDLTQERHITVISAIRNHFKRRSHEYRRDMKLTQRVGLREIRLTIAVCVPSFLLIGGLSMFKDPVAEVIKNILIIFCWVTIWQPFQSLVFDRWTQATTAKVCQHIAEIKINVDQI